jgi:hypothetical protein
MTRLGLIPELAFAEEFKSLRRDAEDIKGAQRVGRDILKPKIIEALDGSGNPTLWDVKATSVPDGFGGFDARAYFTAYFTARSQKEPWATPFYKLMIGSPTTPASPGDTYGFSYPYIDDFRDEDGKFTYHGYFGNNNFSDNRDVYIKVYFYATDEGVLTVTNENTL